MYTYYQIQSVADLVEICILSVALVCGQTVKDLLRLVEIFKCRPDNFESLSVRALALRRACVVK